jgi:3-hydroxy-9,10-secoandrosta-1,3,5(10)-triene-9,17-dione monooxygenase
MSSAPAEATGPIPAPEPDLTPAQLIGRATALRERLIEEAPEGEARGGYSAALHEAFTDAGFFRTLQPRRFGGYEFGLDVFGELVAELAHGDMSAAWSVCLATDHSWHIASWYSEQAQADLFGADGHFCAPHRAAPTGTATPVDGGYLVEGRWDYCSGITHSSHFIATAMGPSPHGEPGDPHVPLACVLPQGTYEIIDDWGAGATIGLQGTGSNSVAVHGTLVPTHHVEPYEWKNFELPPEGTVGYQLHRNPMYLGRSTTIYYGGLAAPMVGAARAALDEYDAILRSRPTPLPPRIPRAEHPDFQRWYGEAQSLTDAAGVLLDGASERYLEAGRRWERGEPFTIGDDSRIRGVMMQSARLAWDAIDIMFRTGGSTAAKRGSRLQRIYRDASMYRTHIGAQYDLHHAADAKVHFGIPVLI